MIIINSILIILYGYFSIFIAYLLFFSLAGVAYRSKKKLEATKFGKFLILVPAYKEDVVIISTAIEAKKQKYAQENFDVCVIADSLKPQTVDTLRNIPVKVVEVSFEVSTKIKSINTALASLPQDYDYILILDADNVMNEDCLERFNQALQSGFLAVQGHRTAKNKNTKFAVLDAITEEVNNHLFRLGHRTLGLSSALIGSGMAFDYQYYKELIKNITVSWEDKEIEFRILEQKHTIEYLPDAYIFDEKVQNAEVYARQRSRWLAGQLYSLKTYSWEAIKQLFKGNVDFFDKVLQYYIPPRVILLGLLPLFLVISLILQANPSYLAWGILYLAYIASILISIPKKLYTMDLVKALFQVPKAIIYMVIGLFGIKKASKVFIHTPHSISVKEEETSG